MIADTDNADSLTLGVGGVDSGVVRCVMDTASHSLFCSEHRTPRRCGTVARRWKSPAAADNPAVAVPQTPIVGVNRCLYSVVKQ